jgi:PAS domain S-box-containing protein
LRALRRQRTHGTSRAKFDTHHRVAGLRRDGTTVDIEVHVRRCVHQGKPAVSAVLLGITDRNRAEAALIAGNAADDAFHTLVEQTLVGIYIIEGERFRYVNPVFAKLFGYDSPEDIIDRIPVVELVAAEDREQVVANVRSRTLAAGTGVRYSFAGLRRDGTTMEVEVHGRSFMHQGKPAVIGALIDITERKRAEAALIAAKVAEGTNAGLVCEIAARKRVEEELVERTLALEQANARLEALSVTDPLTGWPTGAG